MDCDESCGLVEEFRSLSTLSVTKETTHVEMFGDQIPRLMTSQNLKSFIHCYSSYLSDYINKELEDEDSEEDEDFCPQVIAEVFGKYAPAFVSLNNCKILKDNGHLDHSKLDIIVQTTQRVLRTLGNTKSPQIFENFLLHCLVLTREIEDDDGSVTIDILLAFPGAVETTQRIQTEFYPELEEEIKKINHRKGMTISLDRRFYDEPLPMYLAGPKESAYTVTYIAPYTAKSTISFAECEQDLLMKYFPLEQMNLFRSGILDQEDLDLIEGSTSIGDSLIPYLLSVYGIKKTTSNKLVNSSMRCCPTFNIKGFMDNDKMSDTEITDENLIIDMIGEFATMIDYNKLETEEFCKMIGEAISNALNGGEEGPSIWKEIVDKLLVKYMTTHGTLPYYLNPKNMKNGETVEYYYYKIYTSFPRGRITLISMAEAASFDSPVEYDAWKVKWCKTALMESISGSDVPLAKAFYRLNFTEYFCEIQSNSKPKWYFMRNNCLAIDNGGATILRNMIAEFPAFFKRMKTQITKDMEKVDKEKSAYGQDLIAKIDIVLKKLDSFRTLENVLNTSKIYFNRSGVSSYFDENPDLTCCVSCVVVASTKGLYSRPGRLEDFITKSTQARYPEHFNRINPNTGKACGWDDPAVKIIYEWSKQTNCARTAEEGGTEKEIKNMEMVKWWWMFLSSGYHGGNDDKIFPALFGPKGNEGKSAWVWLITKAWGELASKVDTNYFTKDTKDPNAATPVTAGLKGVRWIFVEESEDTRPFLAGVMKKRTGKDTTRARNNFQDGGVMTIQGTFVVVTNDLPPFTNSGSAVVERFLVYHLKAQRSANAPKSIDEQYAKKEFMRDNHFDREVEYYGSSMMWLSSAFFGEYSKEGLRNFPDPIKKATNKYWCEKDKFSRFTTEMYEVVKGSEESVHLNDVYDEFVEWFERRYPKIRIPNVDEVHRELKNKWGKSRRDSWKGVHLVKDSDSKDEERSMKKSIIIRPVKTIESF